jgi:GntR family transcriptional regulator
MSSTAASPLYAQLEASLADRIASGVLAPGAQLAPEDVLSAEFKVSRTTVRATIQRLVQRGLVEIRRGKGTFVSRPKLTLDLSELISFVQDMEANGRRASAHVLGHRTLAASAAIAAKLALRPGARIVQILRVRLADEVAVSYDETYLPLKLGQKVLQADLSVAPIFDVLEQQCETPLGGADYQVEASSADNATAAALRIAIGAPIFYIERTSFGKDKRPVDYERLYFRGDLVRFRAYLPRKRQG